MYSVEDLLISHGYKLPKHTTSSSTPTPDQASSSQQASSSPPPTYNRHHEVLENRPGSRTVNGIERGPDTSYGNGGGSKQPQPYSSGCINNNNEPRDRSQSRREGEGRARSKEREAALHQWKIATERKCSSLGADEWRPAVHFRRQLSQSEGERWAKDQQRFHARTPEGMVVHPRTKAKSQSLPRMLQPESLRVNGHPLSQHDLSRVHRWPENGRPASAHQLSRTPKSRFTRPPRPPSYEMHQQIRGSYEMLSGRDSATIPQTRDRTPHPVSRTGDLHLDYFAQDSGPPGYIPPPSYKRAPIMIGGHQEYGQIAVDYRYQGDVYQQLHAAPDGSHWFTRHNGGSWIDPQRERSLSCQKQLYPVYTSQEHTGGGVQYISFDDPRIRHISSALGGNSLTDADKIRHIRNDAFLPPPLGPFIAAKLADDAHQTSSSNFVNDNNRWHKDLHKETVDNFPAPDQNCNNRYVKKQHHSPLPSQDFQAPISRSCSRQGSDQVFAETITQVKKISPECRSDNNRNTKRRVSETIFCLVSVPIHTSISMSKDLSADQNNNDTLRSPSVASTETFAVDAWALQASQDKELCYAGSWPGNQYRNQETQTGSPVKVVKSPEGQTPSVKKESSQSASDKTTDIGVGTDHISPCSYPMIGQKDLHLSSNSAFSCLSLNSTHSPLLQPSHQPLQQDPFSPPNTHEEAEQPSSPRKSNSSNSDSTDQVAFGQFLLKPVNRRPCDAIGELESINKEMEDTISKRPNMGQSIEFLDGMNNRLNQLKSAHFISGPEPGREAISLPPMHIDKPTSIKVRSKSLNSTNDMEPEDVGRAFSQFQTNTRTLNNNPLVLPDTCLKNNCLLSSLSSHNESNHLYRQDIPVPEESMLRDVGLTVYTETPGGPGEPMQRSLSVPLPLIHKDIPDQLLRGSREVLVKKGNSSEHISAKDYKVNVDLERNNNLDSVPPFRDESDFNKIKRESGRSPTKECLLVSRLTRETSFMFEENDEIERYAIPEALTYNNESTVADQHLKNLLIQEKANALPAEDLSNLYEIKCAQGIPENESIEQRAARILGIAVPVEALGVADRQSEENEDEAYATVTVKPLSLTEETKQVLEPSEQVNEEQSIDLQTEEAEAEETQLDSDQENGGRQKLHNNGDHSQDEESPSAVVLDLPEFPPSHLPLSLPVSPEQKLSLSKCSGDKKGRGGACKLIESLQDKLNSSASSTAASPGRPTADRMTRLKELDSVSRIRRLSLKEFEAEVVPDETKEDREDGYIADDQEKVESLGKDKEPDEERKNSENNGDAHETDDKLGETKDYSYDPSRVERV
uniref:Junctional cadherin 5 associated a n=1 Tax=Cynoglossus semilaevis TaxID=244447 RepID=A0A3P8VCP8_CYNSE